MERNNENLAPVDGASTVAAAVPVVPAHRAYAEEDLMPRMMTDLATARTRLDELRTFIKEMLVPDTDYGKLPGMQAYTLYKPGAEKLLEIYGYAAYPRVVEKIVLGPTHPENPFAPHGPFYSWDYAVDIYSKRSGNLVGMGVGSCNSMEAKYRWRDAQRKCPTCGAAALIYGKPEYAKKLRGQKHWLCYVRKGGCGEEFEVRDPKIIEQEVGKVPNDDVYSLMNTIQKMAKKRALIDAAISVTRSSGMFVPEPGDGDDDNDRDARGPQRRPTDGQQRSQSAGRRHKTRVRGQEVYTAGIEGPTLMAIEAATTAFDREQGAGAASQALQETFGAGDVLDLGETAAKDYLALLRDGATRPTRGRQAGRDAGDEDPSDDIPDFGD